MSWEKVVFLMRNFNVIIPDETFVWHQIEWVFENATEMWSEMKTYRIPFFSKSQTLHCSWDTRKPLTNTTVHEKVEQRCWWGNMKSNHLFVWHPWRLCQVPGGHFPVVLEHHFEATLRLEEAFPSRLTTSHPSNYRDQACLMLAKQNKTTHLPTLLSRFTRVVRHKNWDNWQQMTVFGSQAEFRLKKSMHPTKVRKRHDARRDRRSPQLWIAD